MTSAPRDLRLVEPDLESGREMRGERPHDREFGLDVGRGWFPVDAESHRRDAPRFCPACGAAFALAEGGHGLTTEYWVRGDRVFVCFCGRCGWSGDIVLAERVLGHEAVE